MINPGTFSTELARQLWGFFHPAPDPYPGPPSLFPSDPNSPAAVKASIERHGQIIEGNAGVAQAEAFRSADPGTKFNHLWDTGIGIAGGSINAHRGPGSLQHSLNREVAARGILSAITPLGTAPAALPAPALPYPKPPTARQPRRLEAPPIEVSTQQGMVRYAPPSPASQRLNLLARLSALLDAQPKSTLYNWMEALGDRALSRQENMYEADQYAPNEFKGESFIHDRIIDAYNAPDPLNTQPTRSYDAPPPYRSFPGGPSIHADPSVRRIPRRIAGPSGGPGPQGRGAAPSAHSFVPSPPREEFRVPAPRGAALRALGELTPDIELSEGLPPSIATPYKLDELRQLPPQPSARARKGVEAFVGRLKRRLEKVTDPAERTRIEQMLHEYEFGAIDPWPSWRAQRTREAQLMYDRAARERPLLEGGFQELPAEEHAQRLGMWRATITKPPLRDIQGSLMGRALDAIAQERAPANERRLPQPSDEFGVSPSEGTAAILGHPAFDEYLDRKTGELKLTPEAKAEMFPAGMRASKKGNLYDPHSKPIRARDLPDKGQFLDFQSEEAQAYLRPAQTVLGETQGPRLINLDEPLSSTDYAGAQQLISSIPEFQALLKAKAGSFLIRGRVVRDRQISTEGKPRDFEFTQGLEQPLNRQEISRAFSQGKLPANISARHLLEALNALSPNQHLGTRLLRRLGYDAGHGTQNFGMVGQPPTHRAYLRTFPAPPADATRTQPPSGERHYMPPGQLQRREQMPFDRPTQQRGARLRMVPPPPPPYEGPPGPRNNLQTTGYSKALAEQLAAATSAYELVNEPEVIGWGSRKAYIPMRSTILKYLTREDVADIVLAARRDRDNEFAGLQRMNAILQERLGDIPLNEHLGRLRDLVPSELEYANQEGIFAEDGTPIVQPGALDTPPDLKLVPPRKPKK